MAKLELLSRTIYDANGVQTVWDFNFAGGYILPEHVKAYYEIGSVRTQVTVTPANLIGPNQLYISPAVPAGAVLTIYRDTPKSAPLVDFVDRGTVSEISLDTVAKQAVFVAAEAGDSATTGSVDTAVAAATAAQASALAAAGSAVSANDSKEAAEGILATIVTTVGSAISSLYATLLAAGGALLIGFKQLFPGATLRTVAGKLSESISVKDFGAVGDNVADDTPAFQAALNSAVGVGATITIPAGTYRLASTLNWPQDWPVALVGAGIETTHLNYTGSATAISMFDAGASTKYVKSSIENLRLSGNGSTSVNGVNVRQGYGISLRNVRLYNFLVGLRIEQTWSVILDFVRIDSCAQSGLELHNEANNISAYCCEFLDNARGLYSAGSRSVLFSECTFEACTEYGAYITANAVDSQSESIVFHSCYIEGNATNDIRVILDSGAVRPQSVVVRDCYFVCIAGKASIAVRVDQADHVVVEGCLFSAGSAAYAYSLYLSDGGAVTAASFDNNKDASVNGVYRGTGTAYSSQDKQTAKAWGMFTVSGGAVTAFTGFGISNVTRVSLGVYEVTMWAPMPSSVYAPIANAENSASVVALLCSANIPISPTVFRISTAANSTTLAEARTVTFSVFA